MAGSEAPGYWHCVSLIFVIFTTLRSMEWLAPDYQNYLVFINETGQNISQLPLLTKNMMLKRQFVTYMFNMIYGCFHNQLIG